MAKHIILNLVDDYDNRITDKFILLNPVEEEIEALKKYIQDIKAECDGGYYDKIIDYIEHHFCWLRYNEIRIEY